MKLEIVYSHEVWRTNDKDGSNYAVMFYRILADRTSAEAIEQYCNDTIASGNKVVYDDVTGEVMYRTTRPVADGCSVVRSHSGKWYPDLSKLRHLQAMSAVLGASTIAEALVKTSNNRN